ncbi:MAG: hypothetical protein DI533_00215 [Cereibacter sphaeroides]|uniref:Uncharacterized protein n=1 Tax=Cereibacter sphaeroides TaxID=1063 RepID=A0A2W5UMS4_CERSP|nr:MAG: hypothetical protein DI533_00215 [Cereibacter sphaeroides]
MPKLVRLYIVSCLIGFAIALAFSVALVALDAGNLRHLILETDKGYLAFALLVLAHGVVFAGVQFAIAVMRLADNDRPRGGMRMPVGELRPIPVEAVAPKRR